jgi:catechol 2,3-dioxygenase-like lactoylglutathione lyase family enzyme
MTEQTGAHELRVSLTVRDYDAARRFFRDALGLAEVESWDASPGRGIVLAAGQATLELLDEDEAARVDDLEVGRRISGPIRLAIGVDDSAATANRLEAAGAAVLAPAKPMPWGDVNARVRAPEDVQLTLFSAGETTA